ncbi:hypothetical protein C8J56DRAFT_1052810 [Mycena floridula]|nr:hypothetical protein C8J56DRAFT_1052810 [Mycena floridula]
MPNCTGIDVDSCDYDREGFEFDRKWMIVDLEKNKQLSARDNRGIKLVRVFPSIDRKAGLLCVVFPDDPSAPSFSVPLNHSSETLADWEIHTGYDLLALQKDTWSNPMTTAAEERKTILQSQGV